MKNGLFLLVVFFLLNCSSSDQDPPTNSISETTFYKGMDLSFQTEIESYNVIYKNAEGNSIDLLPFIKSKGCNLVRLKLWHTSQNGENTLNDVKAYARRVKANDMAFLLNFHYSDFWADPGTQTPPNAWQHMNFEELETAVYEYTSDVITQLKAQNTLPDVIQIGNEVDSGFLWDHGRVWDAFANNWPNYARLVNQAVNAIRDADTHNQIKIMLHHSSVENAIYFFQELNAYALDFDIIGLSYYPQFQTKNMSLIRSKINTLATTFEKDIMMVEIAYPFTFAFNDNLTNFIGDNSQILTAFSATPEGQKAYLEWWIDTIKNIPLNKGMGFCYWAPDWVAFPGNELTSTQGSSWENQCLFDFDHKALPVFEVYQNNE